MIQIISATIGGLGFSIVFGVRHKYMGLISLDAGLSWAVYLFLEPVINAFFANMIAAVFCSLFAAVVARFIGVPAVVLQMPATVPMIPGGSLYYTMYYGITGEFSLFMYYLKSTVQTIFAMAIGFAIVAVVLKRYGTELTQLINKIKKQHDI